MFNLTNMLHMEDFESESSFLFFEKWDLPRGFHLPKDYTSPANIKESNREIFYENVPKSVVENLYRVYYEDFLIFGYTAESVQRFHDAAKSTETISQEKIEKAKVLIEPYKNQMENTFQDWELCNQPIWKNRTFYDLVGIMSGVCYPIHICLPVVCKSECPECTNCESFVNEKYRADYIAKKNQVEETIETK